MVPRCARDDTVRGGDVGGAQDGEAGIAGCESGFAFECGGELSGRDRGPDLAVVRDQEFEF